MTQTENRIQEVEHFVTNNSVTGIESNLTMVKFGFLNIRI